MIKKYRLRVSSQGNQFVSNEAIMNDAMALADIDGVGLVPEAFQSMPGVRFQAAWLRRASMSAAKRSKR